MDLATPTIHKSGNSLHVSHGDDKGLFVTFSFESVEVPYKSEQAGHPVFEDVPYVTIRFPGDNTRTVHRPVKEKGDANNPSDAMRWPRQWEAFKSQQEQAISGMPVTEWGPLTKSQAMMLKAIGIHTVEQLAAVPDNNLTWMGAREMQQRARAWLEGAGEAAEIQRLSVENTELKGELKLLQQQVSELMLAQAKSATTKRGKGAAEDQT